MPRIRPHLRQPIPAHIIGAFTRDNTHARKYKTQSICAESKLSTLGGDVSIFRLSRLTELKLGQIDRLPYSIRILLESCLRNTDNFEVSEQDVWRLAAWKPIETEPSEVPFKPARVILQDFTGVPCVVDLASMRGDEASGRKSAEDQSAGAGRSGDRSQRAGG